MASHRRWYVASDRNGGDEEKFGGGGDGSARLQQPVRRATLQTSRKNNKQSDEFGFVKASDDFRLFLIAATILYLKSAWPVAATRISQSRSASSGHNASTPWALRFCS